MFTDPLSKFKYRADIDGLRAIAIIPVVFFHLALGFPGGYVGVDVFFVISGYLITSLILRDLEEGKFSLWSFWERRVRRIFPALIVTILATIVISYFVLLPTDFVDTGKSIVAQALLIANIFFWRSSGYFEGPADAKPLLHTWSLAVEEQFYLALPLLLVLIFYFFRNNPRKKITWIFALIALASFAISCAMVKKAPSATFYLLPTRAWELLLGSLVVVLPLGNLVRWGRELIAAIGLMMILVPCFAYTSSTLFPGMSAMPPCLGTALIIWVGKDFVPTFTSKILASKLPVFIGSISYPLYLIHWPANVFLKYKSGHLESYSVKIELLIASILLATFMLYAVEMPFRKKIILPSRPAILSFGVISSIFALAIGALIVRYQGFENRFSPIVNQMLKAKFDKEVYPFQSIEEIRNEKFKDLGLSGKSSPQIFLWGDSHAEAVFSTVDAICKEEGISGQASIDSATAPLIGDYFQLRGGMNEKALEAGDKILAYIAKKKIGKTILVANWSKYDHIDSNRFKTSLRRTIKDLQETGTKVVILLDVPGYDVQIPEMLAKEKAFGIVTHFRKSPEDHLKDNRGMYEIAKESTGAHFVDLSTPLLNQDGYYSVSRDDVPLYFDDDHLNSTGAKFVIGNLSKELFSN